MDLTCDSTNKPPEWSSDFGSAAAGEPLAGSDGDASAFGLHLHSYNPGTGLVRNFTPHMLKITYACTNAQLKYTQAAISINKNMLIGKTKMYCYVYYYVQQNA